MKNLTTKLTSAIIAAAAVLSFAACSDSSSTTESQKQNNLFTSSSAAPQQTTQFKDPTIEHRENLLVRFEFSPIIDTIGEYKDPNAKMYAVYNDGKVLDLKTGAEKQLSADELAKVKQFRDNVASGKAESKEVPGSEENTKCVSVYDEAGSENRKSTMGEYTIEGFEDAYKLVNDKFKA